MSNTTSVTPYDSESTPNSSVLAGAAIAATACVAGTIAVVRWLAEKTPAQEAAIAAAAKQDRARRIGDALRLTSIGLNLRASSSLISSARALGYQPAGPTMTGLLLLQNAAGNRLAVEMAPTGRLVVHSVAGRVATDALLRQHTFDQVQREFAQRGMDVRLTKVGTGEVQVTGVERGNRNGDGQAVVRADIKNDGTVSIDVSGIKGARCEQIVSGLASAVGGEIAGISRKQDYFELPGEATRQHLKVGK